MKANFISQSLVNRRNKGLDQVERFVRYPERDGRSALARVLEPLGMESQKPVAHPRTSADLVVDTCPFARSPDHRISLPALELVSGLQ